MSFHILYPKPLPPRDNQSLPNENGFTATEIASLRNGWRHFKRRFGYHSKQIFMEFYQEHEQMLEKFRNRMGKFNMQQLHRHPQELLQVYGNLIEQGLDNMTYMHVLMTAISQRHRMFGVTGYEIKLQADHITLYILALLEKIISPTFVSGLEKLSRLINAYHCEDACEEQLEKSSNEALHN
ncbi:uncharacterized protein LOC131804451 [Musca domestica]|uniref:Uncharacterized protein LOC131804451 n=1 Tax=Musca domestica TaxID=7370 RepID=A0ABM3VC29_MUSDO|nr:uncharacterized protein LOC131804451 [Musca domestica]